MVGFHETLYPGLGPATVEDVFQPQQPGLFLVPMVWSWWLSGLIWVWKVLRFSEYQDQCWILAQQWLLVSLLWGHFSAPGLLSVPPALPVPRRGLDGLLVLRTEGPQSVLDPVAELAEDVFRDVQRTLGDEIDADALGADQAHHLLDFLQQSLGRVGE